MVVGYILLALLDRGGSFPLNITSSVSPASASFFGEEPFCETSLCEQNTSGIKQAKQSKATHTPEALLSPPCHETDGTACLSCIACPRITTPLLLLPCLLKPPTPGHHTDSNMALASDVETYLQGVPWPRSNVLNVNEDDPVERYFDLHAYYGSDDSLLNMSRSEASSALTPGLVSDATSPSDLSDSSSADLLSLEEMDQLQMPRGRGSTRKRLEDARLQDGNIVWPQTDPGQRLPRDSILRFPPAVTAATNGKKKSTRRPSSPASRHVKNPAQTAQVRKVGACIKCRIEKLKCSDGGICHSCEHKYGAPLCERTCLRKTLAEAAKHTTPVRCKSSPPFPSPGPSSRRGGLPLVPWSGRLPVGVCACAWCM